MLSISKCTKPHYIINLFIENKIPEISGTSEIKVQIGSPAKIHVNGSDDGNFTYKVISGPDSEFFKFNVTENVYVWTPQNTDPVNIR